MKKLAQDTKALLEEIQDLRLSLFKNISLDREETASARKANNKPSSTKHKK